MSPAVAYFSVERSARELWAKKFVCWGFSTSKPTHTGWWCTYPSEKYEFVNGKDDIPYKSHIWNGKYNSCSKPTHRARSPVKPVKTVRVSANSGLASAYFSFVAKFCSGIQPGENKCGWEIPYTRPGKRLQKTMENHYFQWENPLFIWLITNITMERSTIFHGKTHYLNGPCSIAFCMFTNGGFPLPRLNNGKVLRNSLHITSHDKWAEEQLAGSSIRPW